MADTLNTGAAGNSRFLSPWTTECGADLRAAAPIRDDHACNDAALASMSFYFAGVIKGGILIGHFGGGELERQSRLYDGYLARGAFHATRAAVLKVMKGSR